MEQITLAIIGFAVSGVLGAAGLVYAYIANRDKARLERLIKADLRSLIGNIERIKVSARWGHEHIEKVHKKAIGLERNQLVEEILELACRGKADALSAKSMTKNLLREARAIRDGLFPPEDAIRRDANEKD